MASTCTSNENYFVDFLNLTDLHIIKMSGMLMLLRIINDAYQALDLIMKVRRSPGG